LWLNQQHEEEEEEEQEELNWVGWFPMTELLTASVVDGIQILAIFASGSVTLLMVRLYTQKI